MNDTEISTDRFGISESETIWNNYAQKALKHHNLIVHRAEKMKIGTSSFVQKIETIEGETLILKVSPLHDLPGQRFFYQEIHWIIRTPKVIRYDFSREIIPYDYLILSFEPGRHYWEFETAKQEEIAYLLGSKCALLRSTVFPWAGACSVFESSQWENVLEHYLSMGDIYEGDMQGTFPWEWRDILALTIENPAIVPPYFSLIHGDIGTDNFLVSTRDTAMHLSLIDPGMIQSGDPLWDLAYSQITRNDYGFRKEFERWFRSVYSLSSEEEKRLRLLQLFLQFFWTVFVSKYSKKKERNNAMILETKKLYASLKDNP